MPSYFIKLSTLSFYSFLGMLNFSLAAKVMASLGVKKEKRASSYIM
jgi:hypothetical protein